MQLNKQQRQHLVGLAHSRKPIVRIGQNGLTENVLKEMDAALKAHELVKVKIAGADKQSATNIIGKIESACACESVQSIGHVAAFYRRNTKKPVIILP
ncbi:MAG: ribosome assembly RNA-binding protein YhbY [Pseudomonadota bacterium]